jgi:hypothetical protein
MKIISTENILIKKLQKTNFQRISNISFRAIHFSD